MYPGTRILRYLLVAFVATASPALPQSTNMDADKGQENYLAYCAECHGADGKGDGPRSTELRRKPTDLTLIARSNRGTFNPGAVYQIIDGRKPGSRVHLGKEMPIWGCRHEDAPVLRRRVPRHPLYRPPPVQHKRDEGASLDSFVDLACDSDAAVQERLLSIVGYLSRIQR